jgi:hypothetical protein
MASQTWRRVCVGISDITFYRARTWLTGQGVVTNIGTEKAPATAPSPPSPMTVDRLHERPEPPRTVALSASRIGGR